MLTVRTCAAAWEAVLLLGRTSLDSVAKFLRSLHLLNVGAATPDNAASAALPRPSPSLAADRSRATVIDEKIDGANVGTLGFARASSSLSCHPFFSATDMTYNVGAPLHYANDIVQQQQQQHEEPRDILVHEPRPAHRPVQRAALAAARAVPAAGSVAALARARRVLGRDAQCLDRFRLFGEWVVARHCIFYTRLPDRFVAFDLLDCATGRWAARRMLALVLKGSGIAQVPRVGEDARL